MISVEIIKNTIYERNDKIGIIKYPCSWESNAIKMRRQSVDEKKYV